MSDELKINEVSVTLSVKEWLARIDTKLDTKADKTEIQAYQQRVLSIENRVRKLEDATIRTDAIEQTKEKDNVSKKDNKKVMISLIVACLTAIGFIAEVALRLYGVS